MGTNVHLTPALEQFARDAVESGRYNNVSEVVRSGLRMLQEADARRAKFDAMLGDVEEETQRLGTVSIEDALAEVDEIIRQAELREVADQ